MYEMIQIPEPCSADWEAMSPEGKGRHCAQCCKTVVDFTQWESSDILAYLKKHASAGVCGHFRKAQLDTPILTPDVFVQHIDRSFLSLSQKIAAVFLFVFCIMAASCGSSSSSVKALEAGHLAGLPPDTSLPPAQMITGDTLIPPEETWQGEVIPQATMPVKVKPVKAPDCVPGPVMGGAPVVVAPPMPLNKDSLVDNRDTPAK